MKVELAAQPVPDNYAQPDDPGRVNIHPEQEQEWQQPDRAAHAAAKTLENDQRENQKQVAEHLRAERKRRNGGQIKNRGGDETGFGIAGAERRQIIERDYDRGGEHDEKQIEPAKASPARGQS